ncbi:methylglyoxal reductase (NADPH-dependent) [Saccharomycopsis crataegensis]|uniref:Methylglyoxal reductase (NADPH-dependent) n=1 Tax=Saccharomycopsis crataegensis TaxID=43959 RepID=A0AAV5QQ31_9ASCO|nr:methylglyoxal reductase (NADPH-dependent) [Saccharomycopsis crataegensis]
MSETTVFVSGVTGYIAQHIVKQLLAKGYIVVGTVRSTEKGEKLKTSLNSDKFSYEIVKAIEEEGAFDEALKKHPEATIFLHTASPFHFNATDIEKQLIIPAIYGTKNALKTIKQYGPQVKRVVVTSSYAAMFPKDDTDATITVNENSWNAITKEVALTNPLFGYIGSKTFAEQAVWEFVKTENPSFDVSVINPVFVFGPQAFDENAKGTLNTSAEIINSIVQLKPDDNVPNIEGGYIDVRDVAAAHIIAFEKKEAISQRLLLSAGRFTCQDILDILHEKFPEYAANLPKGVPGSGKEATFAVLDNKKTKEILGFELRNLEQTITDSIKQILTNK